MSMYESPYITQNTSPSSGSARRRAPPVPSRRSPSCEYCKLQAVRRAAVAEVLLDLFAQITQTQDDAANTVAAQQGELMVDERPTRDLDHRLGNGLRDRPQAASPIRPPAAPPAPSHMSTGPP